MHGAFAIRMAPFLVTRGASPATFFYRWGGVGPCAMGSQVMGHCLELSASDTTESSRLVATNGRLTYACKTLPPYEITTCRSLCVKHLLDRTLHLRQTRLSDLLLGDMVDELPSMSAVSQRVPNNPAERCRTKNVYQYPCCQSHQILASNLECTT